MPWSVRLARLAQLDPLAGLPSFQTVLSAEAPAQKRSGTQCRACVLSKRNKAALRDKLSSEVDPWAADMEQMKELLMNIQPAGAVPPPVVVPTQGSPGQGTLVKRWTSLSDAGWLLLLRAGSQTSWTTTSWCFSSDSLQHLTQVTCQRDTSTPSVILWLAHFAS